MLSRREKGNAGKEVRIPQRNFFGAKGFDDEILPRVIFKNQVARQFVLGNGDAELRGERVPGRKAIEVVKGNERLAAENHRREENRRERGEQQANQQVTPIHTETRLGRNFS